MPKYELLPTSELNYFMMETSSKTSFILNTEGKAESLMLIFDGMSMQGKKIAN
jgi:hypothetical protein